MKSDFDEKKFKLKELEREHSRVFANLFTEHDLSESKKRDLISSRDALYEHALDPVHQILRGRDGQK